METPVISNNSANRWTPDVPTIIPEINSTTYAGHREAQRKRLGTKVGFIAAKPNCSIQSYVPALSPPRDFGIEKISVCTYQAISGAGKTFQTWPEMIDNVNPYIGGEEEKSEQEPLRVWGHVENGRVVKAEKPLISAQCLRVPSATGMSRHYRLVPLKPSMDEIKQRWAAYQGYPQEKCLPSAAPVLTYGRTNLPLETRLDRDHENGMGICIGRLREDVLFDYRFIVPVTQHPALSAAGGAGLDAELLVSRGYIPYKSLKEADC